MCQSIARFVTSVITVHVYKERRKEYFIQRVNDMNVIVIALYLQVFLPHLTLMMSVSVRIAYTLHIIYKYTGIQAIVSGTLNIRTCKLFTQGV